jgi:hypothetical protein
MWCAIAMPPYGGFFMAVNPPQKHIFRGALMYVRSQLNQPTINQKIHHLRFAISSQAGPSRQRAGPGDAIPAAAGASIWGRNLKAGTWKE